MKINRFIDHTLLKSSATNKEIIKLCQEAQQYDFAAVCVNSTYLPLAVKLLKNSNSKVCVVNNFPLGVNLPEMKLAELSIAIDQGAQEIDTVINVGKILQGEWNYIIDEITPMAQVCNKFDIGLKVILETCYLDDQQIFKTSQVCQKIGVNFIKTSTGFGTAGAKLKQIKIIKQAVGDKCGIKASGGIKTIQDVLAMIELGATRIGTSLGIDIMNQNK